MAPYVVNWGIIGCGGISGTMARDLALLRPEITDVAHAVVAVGSRSVAKAQEFIDANLPKGGSAQQLGLVDIPPKAYGSYAELFADKNVHAVYMGTLHEAHHTDITAALEAGKHVLVEKPAVLNAAEWADVTALAKKKGLLLMEAFWTRFQPAVIELHKVLHVDKAIGQVQSVVTTINAPFYNNLGDDHRVIALSHAGGPILDVGAYGMVVARVALQDNPENKGRKPQVGAVMSKSRSGADLATTIVLDYPHLGDARAVCCLNFNARGGKDINATIIGTRGEVVVKSPLPCITAFAVRRLKSAEGEPEVWEEDELIERPIHGHGLNLEADGFARDLRDGKLEDERVPHSETQLTFEIFDEVRRIGGYVLPEGMEKVGRVGV